MAQKRMNKLRRQIVVKRESTCFVQGSPIMNTSSRLVGNGRSRDKAKKSTPQLKLVKIGKELVAHTVREVQ